jgi:hypothetical protein
VSVSGFNPYVPINDTSKYGSTYFDGTGDWLTITNSTNLNPGTGNFTIEAWVYLLNTSERQIFSGSNNGIVFGVNNLGQFAIGQANVGYLVSDTTAPITINQWTHLAAVRQGTTLTLYRDGVSVGSATNSTNFVTSTLNYIGGNGTNSINAYISNFRLVIGTAVYTTAFTPPTAPLTAVANTSLLTCQTNQPINNHTFVDYSTNNLLITRTGNATQGTFSPYGENWSNYFDGTGDYLTLPTNTAFAIGTADFTVEAWVYPTTNNQAWSVIFVGVNFGNSSDWGLYLGSGTTPLFPRFQFTNTGSDSIISNTAVVPNQWTHIAVTRSSGTARMFINGTQTATANASTWSLANNLQKGIGAGYNGNGSTTLTGYISNLRVVSGTALYTANFTPPTQPLTVVPGTVLLTCCDNRFVDESPNNFAITRAGDVSVQSFGPFAGTTLPAPVYSVFFDGNSDYISRAWSSEFDLGNTYTIEMWLYSATASGWKSVFNIEFPLVDYFGGMSINLRGTDNKLIYTMQQATGSGYQSSAVTLADTSAFVQNKWYHIAVSVNSGSGTLYVDGVAKATASIPLFVGNPAGLAIGGHYNGYNLTTESWPGYISNFRIVKGTAVYTSNFTPSTSPLTAVSNTLLLTCQSPTVVDNSTNKFALISNGNTKPVTFSPFTAAYSTKQSYTPEVYGGSMYFDGSGDYLSSTSNVAVGTGPFTMECWIYPTALGTLRQIIYNAYWQVGNNGGYRLSLAANNTIQLYGSTGTYNSFPMIISSTTALPSTNQWYHIAVVRNSSDSIMIYINGVVAATAVTYTSSLNLGGGQTLKVGTAISDGGVYDPFLGYISDLRVLPGTALYTNNFLPQNRPLTPVTNTALLLGNTSGAIFDNSRLNVFETLGDAKLSTAITKYGNSSISFDGNGDYIWAPASRNYDFGSGDWTIECWVYFNSVASAPHIWQFGSGSTVRAVLYMNTAKLRLFRGADRIVGATTLVANQWYHLAVSFQASNTTTRLYINGVLEGSVNNFNDYPKNAADIRFMAGFQPYSGAAGDYLNGYISDMRVTKGLARYTANFTPPTVLQDK